MRLLLVGAFPYPHHHGSQIYFQEQAIALRAMGAEVSLLTYGAKAASEAKSRTAEEWRALDGFDHFRSPSWTTPAARHSGPSWAKPIADIALAMTLRNRLASKSRHDAFDAILTHNAEAALTALLALPKRRPAILYCAHTLLEYELSAYLKSPKIKDFSGDPRSRRKAGPIATGLDRLGAGIDRWLAKRSDGWLALTHSCERVMNQSTESPGALIPPSVPDPMGSLSSLEVASVMRKHRLEPDRYFLYSGNLDAYQELGVLASAAQALATRRRADEKGLLGSPNAMPIVIASHQGQSVPAWIHTTPGVRFVEVESMAEMLALLANARASLLMRRALGGFPIKLVNSLAAGTPAIAFHDREWGLEHERNSLICSGNDPGQSMADAIHRLAQGDTFAAQLAEGARALYLERHQPAQSAKLVLKWVQEACRMREAR